MGRAWQKLKTGQTGLSKRSGRRRRREKSAFSLESDDCTMTLLVFAGAVADHEGESK
jgi:hypothetical protein